MKNNDLKEIAVWLFIILLALNLFGCKTVETKASDRTWVEIKTTDKEMSNILDNQRDYFFKQWNGTKARFYRFSDNRIMYVGVVTHDLKKKFKGYGYIKIVDKFNKEWLIRF